MPEETRGRAAEEFASGDAPCIHVSTGAAALLAAALARDGSARFVRVCVGRH